VSDEPGPREPFERIASHDFLSAAASLPDLRLAAHRRSDNDCVVGVDTPKPAGELDRWGLRDQLRVGD